MAEETASATMLELTKKEGSVGIFNANGRNLPAVSGMKLHNGYQVGTKEASYAWINLDDSKMVKLDAVSEMEIRQKGKELELLLNSGNLYFNVTAPLADDETLNIRTSTMVTGIRGTSGWIKVINKWHTRVYILEGSVRCSVTDPVTGQTKWITLTAGQMADFYVYDKNKEGDKCDIIMRRFTEEEIDGFVAVELMRNVDSGDRVRTGGSGLSMDKIAAAAEARLAADQALVKQAMEAVKLKISQQDAKIIDPVFVGNTVKDSGSSSGSGTAPATPAPTTPEPATPAPEEDEPDPMVLTMPVTAMEVNNYLQSKTGVILKPGAGGDASNTLDIDVPVNVPSGKSLTMENGVHMDVNSGQTLQIDGTLDLGGNMVNNGTINNTSMNTFRAGKTFANYGGINNTGRIVAPGNIVNAGTLINSGKIEGDIINNGVFEVAGGESGTVDQTQAGARLILSSGTLTGFRPLDGTLEIKAGTVKERLLFPAGNLVLSGGTMEGGIDITGGSISLSGGAVENGITQAGGTIEVSGSAKITEKTVVAGGRLGVLGGSIESLEVKGAKLEIPEGSTASIGNINVSDGGSVDVRGGFVRSGITVDQSEIHMSGGTVENTGSQPALYLADAVASIEEGSGTLVSNGVVLAGNGSFKMSGGILKKGGAEAALAVNAGTGTGVELSGGIVDGEDGSAVRVMSGRVEMDGCEVKSRDMNSLLYCGNGNAEIWLSDYYAGIQQDQTGGTGIVWKEGTVFSCQERSGGYVLVKAAEDVGRLLSAAGTGEIVVLQQDSIIPEDSESSDELDGISAIRILAGTEEEPVVLDLNGHTLTVGRIIVGEPANPTGADDIRALSGPALEIRDSSGKRGTLQVRYPIENASVLRMRDGIFENIYGGSVLSAVSGNTLITDGAELKNSLEEGIEGLSTNILHIERDAVVTLDGNAKLSSDQDSSGFYEEVVEIYMGGTLDIVSADISACSGGALYVDAGSIRFGEDANLSSTSPFGTVRYWHVYDSEYGGGTISNSSDEGYAVVWYGDSIGLPENPEDMGTDIKGKMEGCVVGMLKDGSYGDWSLELQDAAEALGPNYGVVWSEDDRYYHLNRDGLMSLAGLAGMEEALATASDAIYDDDILDEDEFFEDLELSGDLLPEMTATSSNAKYDGEAEDDGGDGESTADMGRPMLFDVPYIDEGAVTKGLGKPDQDNDGGEAGDTDKTEDGNAGAGKAPDDIENPVGE